MDLLSRLMRFTKGLSSCLFRGSFDQPDDVTFERAQLIVVSRKIL